MSVDVVWHLCCWFGSCGLLCCHAIANMVCVLAGVVGRLVVVWRAWLGRVCFPAVCQAGACDIVWFCVVRLWVCVWVCNTFTEASIKLQPLSVRSVQVLILVSFGNCPAMLFCFH